MSNNHDCTSSGISKDNTFDCFIFDTVVIIL